MRPRFGMIALVALASLALVAPALVSADTTGGGSNGFGTMTVSLGTTAKLNAKLILTMPVTITCTTPSNAISVNSMFDLLNLSQAAGRSIATAVGSTPNGVFVCDGAPHTYTATAQAVAIPFHGGSAVASFGANVCGTLADFSFNCTGVNVGPVVIKISG